MLTKVTYSGKRKRFLSGEQNCPLLSVFKEHIMDLLSFIVDLLPLIQRLVDKDIEISRLRGTRCIKGAVDVILCVPFPDHKEACPILP